MESISVPSENTETQSSTALEWGVLFGVAGLVIGLDQLTKWLIVQNLDYLDTWIPIPAISSLFDITHTRNTGAAFGMAQEFGNVFLIIAMIVVSCIIYYYRQLPSKFWLMRMALGLQMGGAIGNALDRVTRGYVVDFLHVHNFPIFNVADSSIVVGVGVLILTMWIYERQLEAAMQAEKDTSLEET